MSLVETLPRFTAGLILDDPLDRVTREALTRFLPSKPKADNGATIVGICQEFWTEFDPEQLSPRFRDAQAVLCPGSEIKLSMGSVCPVGQFPHGDCQLLRGTDCLSIKGYADPFLRLWHMPSRLGPSQKMPRFLLDPEAGEVKFFHLAEISILVSNADPELLPEADFTDQGWGDALVTVFAPPQASSHAALAQQRRISELTPLLRSLMELTSDVIHRLGDPAPLCIDHKEGQLA